MARIPKKDLFTKYGSYISQAIADKKFGSLKRGLYQEMRRWHGKEAYLLIDIYKVKELTFGDNDFYDAEVIVYQDDRFVRAKINIKADTYRKSFETSKPLVAVVPIE